MGVTQMNIGNVSLRRARSRRGAVPFRRGAARPSMRSGLFGAGLAIAAAISAAGVAAAGTLENAKALIDRGNAPAAYKILKPEERARAGEPGFDYVLGVAAMDSGKPAEAVAAFERVLAVNPDHLQARAELGRAYIALNEPEAARRELAAVEAQESVPPGVKETIARYVDALDTGLSGGGTTLKSHLEITAGYDSNVNNSTSDSRILIPAFSGLGFATLSSGATGQEDGFAEVAGRMSLTHGLGLDRSLFADVNASYRGNWEEDQFNQAIAGFNIGATQRTPDWGSFSLSAQGQSYWVDGQPYRYTVGGLGQWNYRSDGETDYGVYLQYAHLSYPSSQAQNADRYTAGVTLGQSFGGAREPYAYAGIYGGYEKTTDSNFDHLTNGFLGGRLGAEITLMPRLRGYANAAVEVADYKDPDPLFLTERHTVRTDATLGVRYALNDAFTLGAKVSYTNSDSNIVLYEYDRVVAGLSLGVDF